MALKGCNLCIKYLVIIFNLLFWLAGIGVLAVAIWLHVDNATYLVQGDNANAYFTAIYVLMATGSIMAIVASLGSCGAIRESPCMLGTFFVFLLVIFVSELTGGVWAWMNRDKVNEMIRSSVTRMVKEEYPRNELVKKTIDATQRDLKCCGAKGVYDWAHSLYNNKDGGSETELGFTAAGNFQVPESCCSVEKTLCEVRRRVTVIGLALLPGLHQQGCIEALEEHLEEHTKIVVGVAIGLAVIQILGLIFSMVLCCAISRERNPTYKA
ncbi:CD9 antigen-like [Tachypleus tridentatus]|uniref:CD9 antigen-like n=1 Tax=Tachypleus tridentatus TaxID=6853 RepID=UPI003FCF44BC